MDTDVHAPVMRYHGAKWRLAPWIVSFFPDHDTYLEPYGGSAGVLLRKPRSRAEIYNDLDGEVVNLFRVLRDPEQASRLAELCALTPYARAEFEVCLETGGAELDALERARRTVFRAQAGYGSAGATKGRTGFRAYTGSGRSQTTAGDWANFPGRIQALAKRLQGVLIERRPALGLITEQRNPGTLIYADPPYLHETRVIDGGSYYRHEMSEPEHVALLARLRKTRSAVVLSGYRSELYDDLLLPYGWERHETQAHANGRRGTVPRTECLWLNPVCIAARDGDQGRLFA